MAIIVFKTFSIIQCFNFLHLLSEAFHLRTTNRVKNTSITIDLKISLFFSYVQSNNLVSFIVTTMIVPNSVVCYAVGCNDL